MRRVERGGRDSAGRGLFVSYSLIKNRVCGREVVDAISERFAFLISILNSVC